MKVIFKGTYEKERKGCPICSGRLASRTTFTSVKKYYLPSGQAKTFRAGKAEEVCDLDGEFLLGLGCFEEAK